MSFGLDEPGVFEPGESEPGESEPGELEPGVLEPGVVEPGVSPSPGLSPEPLPLPSPVPVEPFGVSTSDLLVWRKPPFLMFFGSSTSNPVAFPAIFPRTFITFSNTSTRRFSIGETFLMVSSRSWMIFAIFAAHFEIAVTACATITGVPKPSENTASNTQAMSFPTRSAIRSRTISRTNPTTMPIIPTTVPTVPAADAAPVNASPCADAFVRYWAAAAPPQPAVPFATAAL
ncbi:hypothetical protein ACQPW3_29615 [Actinosynnema sp. CA-248983]